MSWYIRWLIQNQLLVVTPRSPLTPASASELWQHPELAGIESGRVVHVIYDVRHVHKLRYLAQNVMTLRSHMTPTAYHVLVGVRYPLLEVPTLTLRSYSDLYIQFVQTMEEAVHELSHHPSSSTRSIRSAKSSRRGSV